MSKTAPELLAERFRKQAAAVPLSAQRLLLQEAIDMQRSYMLALEILERDE